ncbi:MAG: diphthine--ammonia ligase [Dehalococcoidia bacterium]
MKAFASWSGGKDCALATYRAISRGYEIAYLLNFTVEDGQRSRSHGIKSGVLHMQAQAMGISLMQIPTSWENYEENFKKALTELKNKGIEDGIFGDMDLEEHREWIERVCGQAGVRSHLPLWQTAPEQLLDEFWKSGFRSIVIASKLDKSLLGKNMDRAFVDSIVKEYNSHPCGESGEYHTFVTDGPIFQRPVKITQGNTVNRNGVWALDFDAELSSRD